MCLKFIKLQKFKKPRIKAQRLMALFIIRNKKKPVTYFIQQANRLLIYELKNDSLIS